MEVLMMTEQSKLSTIGNMLENTLNELGYSQVEYGSHSDGKYTITDMVEMLMLHCTDDMWYLNLYKTQNIVNKGETIPLVCQTTNILGKDVKENVGNTVYFYEVFEPTILEITGDNQVNRGGTLPLTVTLRDEDRSLIGGETVYLYERIE